MKLRRRDGKEGATAFLQAKGWPGKAGTLKDMAHKGVGPKYSIINGVACYLEADLLAYLDAEINKPLRPSRRTVSHAAVQS